MRLRYYEILSFLCVPLLLIAILFGFGQTTTNSVSFANVKAAITVQKSTNNPIIDRVNAIRQENNAPRLLISNLARDIAKVRANDMVEQSYYSHTSPDGKDFSRYIENDTYACENLYLGDVDDFDPVGAWVSSKNHFDCLINPRVTTIGYYSANYDNLDSSVAVLILSE